MTVLLSSARNNGHSAVGERNKETLRRFYQELKRGNYAVVADVYAPDYLSHNFDAPDGEHPGIEGVQEAFRAFYTAFADFEILDENMITEGDWLVHRVHYRATHRGDFLFMRASGKQVTVSGVDVYRFAEGKVVEKWSERDRLSLLFQLGYTVQPAAAS